VTLINEHDDDDDISQKINLFMEYVNFVRLSNSPLIFLLFYLLVFYYWSAVWLCVGAYAGFKRML